MTAFPNGGLALSRGSAAFATNVPCSLGSSPQNVQGMGECHSWQDVLSEILILYFLDIC